MLGLGLIGLLEALMAADTKKVSDPIEQMLINDIQTVGKMCGFDIKKRTDDEDKSEMKSAEKSVEKYAEPVEDSAEDEDAAEYFEDSKRTTTAKRAYTFKRPLTADGALCGWARVFKAVVIGHDVVDEIAHAADVNPDTVRTILYEAQADGYVIRRGTDVFEPTAKLINFTLTF